jgi:hypothetical protein
MIRTHHPINNTREGKKKYSRSKIKKNQNSSTNYQYTGGQKKYSKGKNHKTPNRPTDLSNNPTNLSYNPTDLIKTKPKNKKQIKQYNTRYRQNTTLSNVRKKKKNP